MNEFITVGDELAKNVFQVHGVDAEGAVIVRRQLRRGQVLSFFKKVPHQQAEHMAAPTSTALPSKHLLPTGSRPHMAKSRHPAARNRCLLYPKKRTFRSPRWTSAFDPGCVKTRAPRPSAQ